jgi:uncharacterized protein (DUF1499 family)
MDAMLRCPTFLHLSAIMCVVAGYLRGVSSLKAAPCPDAPNISNLLPNRLKTLLSILHLKAAGASFKHIMMKRDEDTIKDLSRKTIK